MRGTGCDVYHHHPILNPILNQEWMLPCVDDENDDGGGECGATPLILLRPTTDI